MATVTQLVGYGSDTPGPWSIPAPSPSPAAPGRVWLLVAIGKYGTVSIDDAGWDQVLFPGVVWWRNTPPSIAMTANPVGGATDIVVSVYEIDGATGIGFADASPSGYSPVTLGPSTPDAVLPFLTTHWSIAASPVAPMTASNTAMTNDAWQPIGAGSTFTVTFAPDPASPPLEASYGSLVFFELIGATAPPVASGTYRPPVGRYPARADRPSSVVGDRSAFRRR